MRFPKTLFLTLTFIAACTPGTRTLESGKVVAAAKPNNCPPPAPKKQMTPTEEMLTILNIGEPPDPCRPFSLETFKKDIEAGADVNARDSAGLSAIYLATIDHAYTGDDEPQK